MILRIGRELSELSPLSSEAKSCAASTPASIRIVEPLFPQSNTFADFLSSAEP
jgi:hypothetical protein